jgi:2-methylcitrate dehydratase PrpD
MVSVAIDPEFADAHEDYPTRLTVTLGDGRTLEQLRVYASGTRQYPMSPAQIEDKFLDCAAQSLAPAAAKQILATLRTLGEQASFAEFWPLLRRG